MPHGFLNCFGSRVTMCACVYVYESAPKPLIAECAIAVVAACVFASIAACVIAAACTNIT